MRKFTKREFSRAVVANLWEWKFDTSTIVRTHYEYEESQGDQELDDTVVVWHDGEWKHPMRRVDNSTCFLNNSLYECVKNDANVGDIVKAWDDYDCNCPVIGVLLAIVDSYNYKIFVLNSETFHTSIYKHLELVKHNNKENWDNFIKE